MKSPVDIVKGHIVDFNEYTGEVTIKAVYDDLGIMLKREYKDCLVQMIDSRQLSDKQRACCYAMLREIADFTGNSVDLTKQYMKLKFMADDMQETYDKIFSLSNAPMSLVCAFQRYIARFIVEWDIPTRRPMLEYVDDVADYVYSCLINKKCCICGKPADLHHVNAIGAGRDREEIIHEGMEVLPLCREHHMEAHNIGRLSFNAKYHLDGGVKLDKTLCRIYKLKHKKVTEEEKQNA